MLSRTDLIYRLPVVAITDAAVSMVANTRYQGSIAAFTADRNYTLPAGAEGDSIEVALTTGDDLYELILLGASGVAINGGATATEWSRLFISNEFVRLRCIATNDWRVEVDERKPCDADRGPSTGISLSNNTWMTEVNFATIRRDIGNIANPTGKYTIRRAGVYRTSINISLSSSSTVVVDLGTSAYFQAAATRGGSVMTGIPIVNARSSVTFGMGPVIPMITASFETSLAVGNVIELNAYQGSGGSTRFIVIEDSHIFAIKEVL